jgi:hypothetical protein
MGPARRTLNVVGGLSVLAVIAYYFLGYISGPTRVRRLCSEIAVGTSLNALSVWASVHGLSTPNANQPVSFLVERRTFGRFGCKVQMKGGVVESAAYDFAG